MELLYQLQDALFPPDGLKIAALTGQSGPWLYVFLFAIIFCETGLVVTPILPGDSLLFAMGALAAQTDAISFPLLIVVLQNRTGLDNESQLSAVRRLGVRADVIAEAVGQRPNQRVEIGRHRLRERIRRHRGGGRIV